MISEHSGRSTAFLYYQDYSASKKKKNKFYVKNNFQNHLKGQKQK